MIDPRDISYTQGSYLSPVIDGVLLQTEPTVDIEPGYYVSAVDPTIEPGSKYIAPQPALDPIDPIGAIGRVGGLTLPQVAAFWKILPLTGSAETMQEGSLSLLGGVIGYIERMGFSPPGGQKDILDIPTVDFPGSEIPVLPALDLAIPGAGDVAGDIFNVFIPGTPGRAAEGNGLFSNLAGIGKWLIVGAAVLLGAWFITKRK